MKKTKINKNLLILIPSIYVWWWAEKIATVTWNNLNWNWYKTHYFTFYKYNNNYETVWNHKCLNFKFIDNVIYKFLIIPAIYFKLFQYVKKNKIDIIISHMEYSALINFLIKKSNPKIRSITVVHWNLYKKGFWKIITKLYKYLDKTISVSKQQQFDLKKDFNLKNTGTIYNPFEHKKNIKLSNMTIEKRDIKLFEKSEWYKFINIGRLVKQKWQRYLIRAFKEVVNKYPDSKLFILGEWELRPKLKKLIDNLELNNNIFLIWIRNNIFSYIKKCNSFVLSSLREGLPTVLIESLHIPNISIISTDCKTWPREILSDKNIISKKIQYPYSAEHWIIISDFERKYNFKTIEEKNLSENEKMLSKVMIDAIENKNILNSWKKAAEFDFQNIINERKKIL